ncbi:MAG: hypothetical protein CME70_23415 [Halobacteriovorax sp.]|nr:hypothetical protein [Halobacteriovorax sp.]|tara:strand:+ start:128080 stop:128862 length:783 start_codon:yes stop_codon:yes gene_type:complete
MLNLVKNNPLILILRKIKYERKFRNNKDLNLFKGVFSSYQSAFDSIPSELLNSYDNESSAKMYKHLCSEVFPSDYANMFWLSQLIRDESKVFDLGGHIGVKYYSYQQYFNFPESINWTVFDTSSAIEEGKKFANQKGEHRLKFSEKIDEFDDHDILFVSGALQYIDINLSDIISKKASKPKFVLITLPLTQHESFYTINNLGTACCVYIVRNENEFIKSFEDIGYEKKDDWNIPAKYCEIPFFEKYSLENYRGLLFEFTD